MLRISIDRTLAHRAASLLVATLYVAAGYAAGGGYVSGRMVIFTIMPLAMIWLPDAMGDYTGRSITASSPGSMVRFGGWMFLLMPFGFAVVSAMVR